MRTYVSINKLKLHPVDGTRYHTRPGRIYGGLGHRGRDRLWCCRRERPDPCQAKSREKCNDPPYGPTLARALLRRLETLKRRPSVAASNRHRPICSTPVAAEVFRVTFLTLTSEEPIFDECVCVMLPKVVESRPFRSNIEVECGRHRARRMFWLSEARNGIGH